MPLPSHPPHTPRRPLAVRPAATLALALVLAGCATAPPGPGPGPEPGEQARHAADLAECQRYAQQIGVATETLDGMLAGALVLASLAWSGGGSRDTVRDWAVAGGALGATQGLRPLERRRRAVESCMQARGYATGPYPVAMPLPPEPAPAAPVPLPSIASGVDGFNAGRLARAQSCSTQPVAALAAKGPGFETYTVACENGDALAIRCEFGNCRVLR
ncbi:glycine zipper family protein [Acidovorax sp. NCPPB 2350]|nr:glycine zipper family protein [Acidovorax sp. NCPPB 2350]